MLTPMTPDPLSPALPESSYFPRETRTFRVPGGGPNERVPQEPDSLPRDGNPGNVAPPVRVDTLPRERDGCRLPARPSRPLRGTRGRQPLPATHPARSSPPETPRVPPGEHLPVAGR